MEGLVVVKDGNYLANIRQTNASLGLLANFSDIDVMIQEIGANNPTWIEPGESGLTEFYYVLNGSLVMYDEESEQLIEQGDSFYVSEIKKPITVKTEKGAKLLYFTNKPAFNNMYSNLGDFNELLKRSEKKDIYTYDHGKRVNEFCVKMSEKMGLSPELIDIISISSLLHDVGKIYIPDGIINKPFTLSSEEFKYIMKHPIHGRALVEGKFGKDVGEIIEQHHERLDGSGYPFGLSENEIRIEAKIIAVADSYDAMTTEHPYRGAISPLKALEELDRCTGTFYDEDIVNSIREVLIDEGKI